MAIILDTQLNVDVNLKTVSGKTCKTIGLLRKFHNHLIKAVYLLKYKKAFIRPHLHYGDILFGQAYQYQSVHSVKYLLGQNWSHMRH